MPTRSSDANMASGDAIEALHSAMRAMPWCNWASRVRLLLQTGADCRVPRNDMI